MGGIHETLRFPKDPSKTHVVLNMVQSADGKAAIEGKASGLGTDIDRAVMRTLRSKADAVMVGGGTIRSEKLSLSLDAEDERPVPRAVILTNTGDLPLERNLVRDHRQDVLVLLPENARKGAERSVADLAETRRVPAAGSGTIDVARALKILKRDYGTDVLLCEGGPTLNQALINADLADELFLTIAPKLVGAEDYEEAEPSLRKPLLRLLSLHRAGDELFLRYAVEKRR